MDEAPAGDGTPSDSLLPAFACVRAGCEDVGFGVPQCFIEGLGVDCGRGFRTLWMGGVASTQHVDIDNPWSACRNL